MISIIHSQSKLSENDSLEKLETLVYSEFTTKTISDNRSCYTSGIFLPEFYHFKKWGTFIGVFHSLKLVTRATRRNKALSTNNAGWLMAVVDPLLHLLKLHSKSVLQVLFTKTIRGISMLYTFFYTATRLKITIYAQTLAQAYARKPAGNAVLVIRQKGGCYA